MSEIDIELTAACDRLRIMIRNEQQTKDYAEAWRKMATTTTTTSSTQGGLRMKLRFYLIMYRLTGNRRWISRYVAELNREILEDIRRFRNETNR